jgi:glycosyltransferase involved in cell wall biosynthesis/tetratricopeptide (TPR) repeat protein
MAMQLAQLRAELAPLEQRGDCAALLTKATDLLPSVADSSSESAHLLYCIGKALVGLARYSDALAPLQRSLAIDAGRAHGHYLLGYCLARQRQWPAALGAQQCSSGLDPRQADSWYEQGRAALELGQDQLAVAALDQALQRRPGWAAALALRHAARVRLALAQGLAGGVHAIRAALAEDPLPPWILHEWCALAGALLLAGELGDARLLLAALSERQPLASTFVRPLPRRLALLLGAVLELLDPADPKRAGALSAELRESLWLPPCTVEQSLWHPVLEPALAMLLGRVPDRLEPVDLGGVLLRCIPVMAPPTVNTRPLMGAIAQRLPDRGEGPFLPFARRIQAGQGDLTFNLAWLPDALLAAGERLAAVPADAQVRRWLDRHLQVLSRQMLAGPGQLAGLPGQDATARRLRSRTAAALVEASQAFAALDQQPPVRRRQAPRRRWLLLASSDLPQCVLYRVEQKREQLQRLGCEVRVLWREQLEDWTFTRSLLWAEAVVVCRLPATHAVLRAMATARRFGLPLYYDIDDLLFDPALCPPPLATYGGTITPVQHRNLALDVPLIAAAMAAADGLIVSTACLAQRWQALQPSATKPVWILPNLAPPALWLGSSLPRRQCSDGLRLVFASGTTAHKQAWQEELAPAVASLLRRNPQLRLDLLGHVQIPQTLLPFSERIQCRPYTDYGSYLRRLGEADIGLVVLEPGVFTDAKSAIRWMEFSLLGLASVLSPTATYTAILQHERDVLFARGFDQWVQQIQRLVDDPALRKAMAERAHSRARELFAPTRADAFWAPLIRPPELAAAPLRRRRRLLVIHVFFAPQSMGGATRVVQDQVLQVLQQAGDRYEVTVLCADHQPWQAAPEADGEPDSGKADSGKAEPRRDLPLTVDCHDWHGARVVRLAVPFSDWRDHHDERVAAFCRQWFADEDFDLIHAHCLQMLTAAPLQVAAELAVPYLVTLHDGWWLSPRLFLTTITGQPIDPADPLGHFEDVALQSAETLAADQGRRQALAGVLAMASARVAVSAPFAEVYQRGGVSDIRVVENDWQPMVPLRRRVVRPADEPLRMCFVGGLAVHKGYAVLQAALFRHSLALHGAGACLTVIDATLEPDQVYALDWNGTPVQAVPSVPMVAMEAFYANHDVLIAPSIWPESFGLVTREALSAGLWVVASDMGALADPIEPGINGSIVPPGDAEALAEILCQLCRDHPHPPTSRPGAASGRAIDALLPLYDQC